MAFQGYHIRVGNTVIPEKYIKYDSLQTTYETLDLDSYRDANGNLHRNALSHRSVKVEFETPYLYHRDMQNLMSIIRNNYVSAKEQSVNLSVYIDELDDYVEQKCYLVNTTWKKAQNSPLGYIYQPTRIAFIGY